MSIARTLVLLLVLTAPMASAQQEAPREVQRPEVKVGDRWIYRRVDLWTNHETTRYEMVVSFSGPAAIHVVNREGDREIDVSYTAEWNVVNDLQGAVFTPHSGFLRFPLKPGAAYETRYDIKRPREGAFHMRVEIPLKVTGWQEIAVPAGRFRTLRITGDGSYARQDTAGGGGFRVNFWYAPEVKRWVRGTIETTDFRGQPFNRLAEELVEYKVQ